MKKKMMMTENYCDECDEVVHQVFGERDFYKHKVGRIICPVCGHFVMPCNECNATNCEDCPWKKSEPTKGMDETEYIVWYKENDPKVFDLMKSGDLGEYFKKIANEL